VSSASAEREAAIIYKGTRELDGLRSATTDVASADRSDGVSETMGTIDKVRFERRGARGCSNSDYDICQTTCCDVWCVEDDELSDLYVDPADLSAVIGLYGEDVLRCPFCRSATWDLRRVVDLASVPEDWRWALARG
jgi:hypothetical protein